MAEQNSTTMRDITVGMIVGSLVGASIALLFAPAAGVETRQKVKEAAENMRNRMKKNEPDLEKVV